MLARAADRRLSAALSGANPTCPQRRIWWYPGSQLLAALSPRPRLEQLKPSPTTARHASSSSSTRWKSRQIGDPYARDAKVAGLKSRAAFKLLEISEKYKIFRRGDTVVDLGFAPGSWSQVAVSKTSPGGRVVGIDVIPAQPPRGANALQGNFLSAEIREEVRKFVAEPDMGRVRHRGVVSQGEEEQEDEGKNENAGENRNMSRKGLDAAEGRLVNVVLSDMSAPWPLVTSTWIRSVSDPYRRMMNTSGLQARDHGGSMDLCMAALTFAYDTLATGGHFLCKFYTGSEDQDLEQRLNRLFEKVHRIKPDATRKESKEAYFLGLRRKVVANREDVIIDG